MRTHIGYGSPGKQDTFEAHGAPLGEEEVKRTKQKLGWPAQPPFCSPDVMTVFASPSAREKAEAEWNRRFFAYAQKFPDRP